MSPELQLAQAVLLSLAQAARGAKPRTLGDWLTMQDINDAWRDAWAADRQRSAT